MEILKAEEENRITDAKTVVALGNFDGLHLAHMKVIRRAKAIAEESGILCGVLLFEEHTDSIIPGKHSVPLITPNEAKLELLGREDLDFVYIRRFTPEFMRKSPDEFVRLLLDNLNIAAVCVGYDYRFGHKASGSVETLKDLGKKYGFEVDVTGAVKLDGEIVSSTAIRAMIADGDMEKAERFLNRRFCVQGPVEHGMENGKKMGIPTANVAYSERMAIPAPGVYAGITYTGGKRLKCVINVGNNPTFGAKRITIESHILDFDGDIYGQNIRVSFAKRLRGEIKFASADELRERIRMDIETVRGMEL